MNWLRIGTKRALSAPITSAILLSAVATMGVFLVGWSNTTLTLNQAELEATFSNKINKLGEEILIEHVWFGTQPTKFVNVTLSNISTLGLTITDIELVEGTTTTSLTVTNGDVLPDQTFSVEEAHTWTSGNPIDVIVTTARGNIFTTQVSP